MVADPRRYPEWQSAIVALAEVLGAWPAVGASYSATYEVLGRRLHGHFVVTAADRPTTLRVQGTTAGGWTSWSTHPEAADGGGTLLRVELDYELPASLLTGALDKVAAFVLRREIRRTYADAARPRRAGIARAVQGRDRGRERCGCRRPLRLLGHLTERRGRAGRPARRA